MKYIAFISLLAVSGCGDGLPAASKVETLRVFAVSKQPSIARPGEPVTVQMLWHEPRADRPTQIAWFSGCWNVEGDLFYRCFPVLSDVLANLEVASDERVGFGSTYTLTVPSNVISERPPPADQTQEPYGLGYVFFAACSGELGPATGTAAEEFPLSCFDEQGKALSADDFVVGYVQVYASESEQNQSPRIAQVSTPKGALPLDCIGEDCVDANTVDAPIDCEAGDNRCVDCVKADDADDCDPVTIQLTIDRESLEIDPVATNAAGEERWEQTWARFYADGGKLAGDIRLLVDPTSGPRDSAELDFDPTGVSGEVRMWVTVHDNRGGTSWARLRLVVKLD